MPKEKDQALKCRLPMTFDTLGSRRKKYDKVENSQFKWHARGQISQKMMNITEQLSVNFCNLKIAGEGWYEKPTILKVWFDYFHDQKRDKKTKASITLW